MKVKTVGKNSVQITMTLQQLETLQAALDSVSDLVGHGGGGYDDVPKLERALSHAIRKNNFDQLVKASKK